MRTVYKYIQFEEIATQRRTSVWSCCTNRTCIELGQVRWYERWRQYCYFPVTQAVYSASCLEDIQHFITQLANQRLHATGLIGAQSELGLVSKNGDKAKATR